LPENDRDGSIASLCVERSLRSSKGVDLHFCTKARIGRWRAKPVYNRSKVEHPLIQGISGKCKRNFRTARTLLSGAGVAIYSVSVVGSLQ
jgi:hypothetical protein